MSIIFNKKGMETVVDYIKKNAKTTAVAAVLILIVATICFLIYQHNQASEANLCKATTMTEEQAKNIQSLESELKISKQNAELLAKYVGSATAGKITPVVTFVQPAATVQTAATDVKDRINANDKTLPSAAIEKTDRTVVVPQQVTQKDGTKDYQVGVYKVNNYRNWEISAGVGRHGDDSYIPIEIQRNYDKIHSLGVEYHAFGHNSGYEVKYTVRTDKLLVLF